MHSMEPVTHCSLLWETGMGLTMQQGKHPFSTKHCWDGAFAVLLCHFAAVHINCRFHNLLLSLLLPAAAHSVWGSPPSYPFLPPRWPGTDS